MIHNINQRMIMRNCSLTYIIYFAVVAIGGLFSAACLPAEKDLVLMQAAIGPINKNTPFNQQALQKLFPTFIVKKAKNASEGEPFDIIVIYQHKKPLITLAPIDELDPQSKILCASFSTNAIKNRLGAPIGSSFASVYPAHSQIDCVPGKEEMSGLVICSAPKAKNIDYVFAGHWDGPDGLIPPSAILKNWTLKQITWLTDEKFSLRTYPKCGAIGLRQLREN